MTEKVLTFYLRDNLLGIDITLVKEIDRNVEYTPVPGADPHIAGLFNMRGQVVTLLDISKIMGYEDNNWERKVSCIILKAGAGDQSQAGFLIDRFGDVLDINDDECEPPPANAGGISGEFIKKVVKLKQELLIILDPERIFKYKQREG